MTFSGETAVADDTGSETRAAPRAAEPRPSTSILPWAFPVTVDRGRDALLTDFGRETLSDRYLLPGELFQDLFARVAAAYADDADHAQRLYDYISRLWFMPSTPVLSNGGTGRGLPISCYLNSVGDSLDDIVATWNENVWLAARGGGIGTYWGHVRGIGEPVGLNGKTSGIIPFVRVMDSLTLAISQGSLRRGSAAVYLDVSHPEIEEFLEIRKPSGDFNRKALNLHHGVLVTDKFMEAVRAGAEWHLVSPKTGDVRATVDARGLFTKLVETRLATGEPYIVFIDHVNDAMPKHQRDVGLKVSTSNLCSEITLPTGVDQYGKRPHRGVLPVEPQPRILGRLAGQPRLHRGRHALPRQRAAATISPAPNPAWSAPPMPRCANARSASASWGSTASSRRAASRSRARWRSRGT